MASSQCTSLAVCMARVMAFEVSVSPVGIKDWCASSVARTDFTP